MALGLMNFRQLGAGDVSPIAGLVPAIQQGMMFPQQLQHQQLANALQQLQNQKMQAEIPYAADTAKANNMYKTALAKYYMSPALQERGLTNLGKSYVESGIIPAIKGSMNASNQSVNQPGNSQDSSVGDAYNLYRQKMITDSSARQKNLYATNIEKTLNFINPDDLTQYSGLKGIFNKQVDKFKASEGNQPESYDKYQRALNAAQLLATQVRQFYGDSIQPNMIERLEKLTNPSTWDKDPKLAKQIFNQTKDILGQELGTYRQSMKSTGAYEEQSPKNKKLPEGTVQSVKSIGSRNFIKMNGKWYEQ